jgi:hypothetical protein
MNKNIIVSCRCAATRLVFGALHSREAFVVRALASVAIMGIRSFLN